MTRSNNHEGVEKQRSLNIPVFFTPLWQKRLFLWLLPLAFLAVFFFIPLFRVFSLTLTAETFTIENLHTDGLAVGTYRGLKSLACGTRMDLISLAYGECVLQTSAMKRVIDHYLGEWKQRTDRKALLLRGASQVGKTYAVRELGKKFDELVEINLELHPEYGEVFRPNLDPNRILRELRLMTGRRLDPGSSLLFIDEIQQQPLAVSALRYFHEEIPELHVIAAGSLLEFAIEQVGLQLLIANIAHSVRDDDDQFHAVPLTAKWFSR